MTNRYAKLRAASAAVPHVKWYASRSNVTIPETDDWAGATLLIGGLDRRVSRPYARYIADANPETISALLADFDEASARAFYETSVAQAAIEQVKVLEAERDKLRDLLTRVIGEVDDLIGESSGVYGLHLNGDSSPWDEVVAGGRFERLGALEEARAALAQEQGESDAYHHS